MQALMCMDWEQQILTILVLWLHKLIYFAFFPTATEIEHISAMFQEKQQELQAAVLKVDQLTQQLEDLRKGKLNGFQSYNGQMTGPAAVELKKLYQELQVNN